MLTAVCLPFKLCIEMHDRAGYYKVRLRIAVTSILCLSKLARDLLGLMGRLTVLETVP